MLADRTCVPSTELCCHYQTCISCRYVKKIRWRLSDAEIAPFPHIRIFFFLAEISSNQDSTWWGEKSFMTELFFHHKPYLAWHSMFRAYYYKIVEPIQKTTTAYKSSCPRRSKSTINYVNPPGRQIFIWAHLEPKLL